VARLRGKGVRPRRTREHVIAAQSSNYVESFILAQGHTVDRPIEDYGYDMLVSTFDDRGFAESGEILIQIKATDRPRYSSKREFISFVIDVKHYELWRREPMPVFLVVYDASQKRHTGFTFRSTSARESFANPRRRHALAPSEFRSRMNSAKRPSRMPGTGRRWSSRR